MYWIKGVQLISALSSIMVYFIIGGSYVFLLFSGLSSFSIILSNFVNEEKQRFKYNLEYLSSILLISSILAILLGYFLIPIIYLFLGGIISSLTVTKAKKNIIYLNDFYAISLSLMGFWVIYYKFIDLGAISFLLAINTSLTMGVLIYVLMEEDKQGNAKPSPNIIKIDLGIKISDVKEFFLFTTFLLTLSYIILLYLEDYFNFFINLEGLAIITISFAVISIILYIKER